MLGFIWHTEHHIYVLPCIYIYWWSLCPAKWMYQCQKVAWSCVHMNKEDTSLQSQFLIHTRKDTCEFQKGDCCLEYSIYHTAQVAPYMHAWNRLLFVFKKSQRGNILTACGMCTHTVDLPCLMSCSAKTWLGWVAHHNPIRNDHWRSESNVDLSIMSFNRLPSDNFWLLIHTSAIHHYYSCAHFYCSYF